MRPRETFISQPIRDLQTMLRVIARHKGIQNLLVPDGIYGASTMQAVSDFQKAHGLPPTGSADYETWQAILNAYIPARLNLIEAYPLYAVLNANEIIESGDQNPNVYLVQSMLEVISQAFKSVKSPGFSGMLDSRTKESLISFQLISRLEATGKIDKITWKHLVLQYPLAASFFNPLSQEDQQ